MKEIKLKRLISFIVIISNMFAYRPNIEGHIVSSPLVDYSRSHAKYESVQNEMNRSTIWNDFKARHGDWKVFWHPITKTPHRAYGKPVTIPGFRHVNQHNVRLAGETFIEANKDLLKASEYSFVYFHRINNFYVVIFQQMMNEIPVWNSFIHLRISTEGYVFLFGSNMIDTSQKDFYPVQSDTFAEARNIAELFAPEAEVITSVELHPDFPNIILPFEVDGEIVLRSVMNVNVETSNPDGKWATYIDAETGELIWQFNLYEHENVTGTAHGNIYQLTPWGPELDRPFQKERIYFNGTYISTNSDGEFSINVSSETTFGSRLRGPWINVIDWTGPEPYEEFTASPGEVLDFYWTDDNSEASERNAFYHGTVAHEYVKDIESGFTGVDHQITIYVDDYSQSCNGYWGGDWIRLYGEGDGCVNYAEVADVIIHEYGHAIMGAQYGSYYPSSSAISEALPDYYAGTVTNNYYMCAGCYGPGSYNRSINNNLVYPDDLIGEVHYDGLPLVGALWDTREVLGRTYTDTLYHWAKYARATGYSPYDEFYLDILSVDDDDNDLTNGTPNWIAIGEAFHAHGIGVTTGAVVNHTPLYDTQNTTNPYLVMIQIESSQYPISEENIKLYYSVGLGYTSETFVLHTPPNVYQAEIPPQPAGNVVKYYIQVTDDAGQTTTMPTDGAGHPYFFLVGQAIPIFIDNFENDLGWTVGAEDDDATAGIWVREDPVGTSYQGIYPQPESDHSGSGTICWVTGNGEPGGSAGANDVDGGKTTLYSPVIDMTGLAHPVISYYRWYALMTAEDDEFMVDVSSDSGQFWIPLERVSQNETAWTQKRYLVDDYVTPTDKMILRFTAQDYGDGSVVEALVDDFYIIALDSGLVAIDDETLVPNSFELFSPYPNPFNPKTVIGYQLPEHGDVTMQVFDIKGRLIKTLIDGFVEPGFHEIEWNATDNNGIPVSTGVYFCKITIGHSSQTKKVLFLK